MPKSYFEWRPDPLQGALEELETITVDTSRPLDPEARAHYRLLLGLETVAEILENRTLKAYHVTDNPQKMIDILESGADLLENPVNKYPGLCPGVRVSDVPSYWRRYSSKKRYEFIEDLDQESKELIAEEILKILRNHKETKYITQQEYIKGELWVTQDWLKLGNFYSVLILVDQPYNIDIPSIAHKLGIFIMEPYVVKVLFKGRYLSMVMEKEALEAWNEFIGLNTPKGEELTLDEVCKLMRRMGWDGNFTPPGFSTEAQLMIMNADKILQYGDWKRS